MAVATVPDSSGVIHACVQLTTTTGGATVPEQFNPNGLPDVTIIDPSAGQHCIAPDPPSPNQTSISWNVQGPPGQTGAQGAPGKTATVTSGHTLTLAGGQVLTVGGGTGNTYNFISPPPKPSGNKLTIQIDSMTVPLLSYSFANTNQSGGTGGASGRAQLHDITITKKFDKSSAKLFQACSSGKHFQTVVITVRKAGGSHGEFLRYTFRTVFIRSAQTIGSGGKATPSESLTLNYSKVEFKYNQQ